MTPVRLTALAMSLVVAVIIFASCGAERASDSAQLPVLTLDFGPVVPSDEVFLGSITLLIQDISKVSSLTRLAEDFLIEDCMNSLGFEFPVDIEDREMFDPAGPAYIHIDLEDWAAATEGYGINLTEDDGPPDTGVSRHLDTLSESALHAWDTAFFGTTDTIKVEVGGTTITSNSNGCLAEARDQISGDPAVTARFVGLSTYVSGLGFGLDKQAVNDERYLMAMQRWKDCMAAGGFHFEDLYSAMDVALSLRQDPNEPGSAEIEQAVVDKNCQHSSEFWTTYHDLLAESEQPFLESPEINAIILEWEEISSLIVDQSLAVLADNGVADPTATSTG